MPFRGARSSGQRSNGPGAIGTARLASRPQRTRRNHGCQHPRRARPDEDQAAHRARGAGAQRAHEGVGRDVRARAALALGRRRVVLPAPRPVADLSRARRRPARLGRRRQRVLRLPQRLRLDGPGPRPPGDRQGDLRALLARHALRRADRGRDRRRRGAVAPLGPAALALHELRLRVDDGRDPDRPRVHEARDDHEDLRLLPRPPRRRDGLDRRRVRQDRRPLQPRVAGLRRRHPAGRRRPHDRRAVQRPRGDGAPHRGPDRRGPQARLRDHGGGDDEPRDRASRAGLPRGDARDHAAPRHRPDLRRGQDRASASRPAARPSAGA